MQSPQLSQAAVSAGKQGLARAVASAPRRSGRFASGFEVVPATVQAGRRNEPRAGALVRNAVPYAAYVHKSKVAKNFMASLVPHINSVSGR